MTASRSTATIWIVLLELTDDEHQALLALRVTLANDRLPLAPRHRSAEDNPG
jgi:hypothetical protein